eukprot:m.256639 g.256639  ORF g.256639 m.256639 type:complete len:51 (+) comp40401_c0_seq32:508-660(+)
MRFCYMYIDRCCFSGGRPPWSNSDCECFLLFEPTEMLLAKTLHCLTFRFC